MAEHSPSTKKILADCVAGIMKALPRDAAGKVAMQDAQGRPMSDDAIVAFVRESISKAGQARQCKTKL